MKQSQLVFAVQNKTIQKKPSSEEFTYVTESNTESIRFITPKPNEIRNSDSLSEVFSSENPTQMVFYIAGIAIYPEKMQAMDQLGNIMTLTKKECELLLFLYLHRNRAIQKSTLLEMVWDYDLYTNTNTLEVHISNLRRKFKKFCSLNIISTIYGGGYRLINQN